MSKRSFLAVSLFGASLFGILAVLPVNAQSLQVKNPAPLAAGINTATVDSFVGPHFWYFTAQPGSFHIEFVSQSPSEGFRASNSKTEAAASFAPRKPGSNLTFRETQSGVSFQGSCTVPNRVIVMVQPMNSPLVRQTTNYTLNVTGSASFGAEGTISDVDGNAASTPSVVGAYDFKLNDFGSAKLRADGTVETTSGDNGTWELFDAPSRTYLIKIRGMKLNLTFQPGRGFIDGHNGNIVLEMKQVH